MDKNPTFSIVVPVYKVEAFLEDCIKSILTQSFRDFELILVDDGSPDSCPAICDNWALKDERIKVVHKINGGLSEARNYGIEAAVGKYVWFVDSDDWIANDALAMIVAIVNIFPNADAIATQIIEVVDGIEKFHGNLQEWPKDAVLLNNYEYVCRMTSILPSVRYIVKRHIYENCNLRFIVGVLHEDMPFCHMLMNFAKLIAIIPEVTYYYRIRGGSITTSHNIDSCYSLVKSHKELMHFMTQQVSIADREWFIGLTYDFFYEIFLRIHPFLDKKEYIEFMNLHGDYVRREFKKVKRYLKGKRKWLVYVFSISPRIYSQLIYKRRQSKT